MKRNPILLICALLTLGGLCAPAASAQRSERLLREWEFRCDHDAAAEKRVVTAGKAHALRLAADRTRLAADGEDLAYVNVSLVDRAGNPVPVDSREVRVSVSGAGRFRAMANGDPTSLELFHEPHMHLFSGQLTVLVQSGTEPGEAVIEVTAPGVRKARLTLEVE